MSTEVIPEVVVEEQVDDAVSKIREERKLAETVRDYVNKSEHFEKARSDFNEICVTLRDIVKPNTCVVCSGGYGSFHGKHFLLIVSEAGNFNVKPIEVI